MVVAIDGPAGAGKSSVAARCAAELGFVYLNSGAIYRAVTWKALQDGLQDGDAEQIAAAARSLDLQYRNGELMIDGQRRDDELHGAAVDQHVARHSAIEAVRAMVNRRLHQIAERQDVVVEGRDITTVVFPRADVKIYLDASVETRARRRWQQQEGDLSLQQISERIIARDEADRRKTSGSLQQAADAIYLDTSDLTIAEVCDRVIHTIQNTSEYQELQG
ncbi:MAG: (d)CMP kinase [Spirochaetaceae bacterium]|nr:MAG: (d)CMP kinase [Spirochaetaceae bacterium]